MSQLIQRIDGLGRREATTVATSTNQRVFAATQSPASRQGINIANLDSAADLLIGFTAVGAADPGFSSTNCDLIIPARTSREVSVGVGIDLWVRTTSTGSASYVAQELL